MVNDDNEIKTEIEEKPFYKTKKGILAIVAVCCVGILVIGGIASILSPDKTSTTTTSTSESNANEESVNNEDTSNSEDTSSASGLQVRITYDGSWSGAIGTAGETTSYDGTGDKTIDIDGSSYDIVSASIQKQGGGSGKLKVEILKDGNVVKESSTTAAYGVVSIAD